MPDTSQPAGKSRTAHGPAPHWLRLASICVVLIAVPVGLWNHLHCLIDTHRKFSRPAETVSAEASYFLERIDSIVGGRMATTLAVDTGCTTMPVAVAGVYLNALEWAVPPRHVDFAVVERETGRTLFHSDRALAMTTTFVDDTGRDPALLALLRSDARDTIALVYAGVPIRAHVRPLRPGLPWTLVVYRGHELEDSVGGLTATLSPACEGSSPLACHRGASLQGWLWLLRQGPVPCGSRLLTWTDYRRSTLPPTPR